MPCRRLLLLLILAPFSSLHAQDDGRAQADGPIQMTPDLALAIPFVQHGHDVSVKFPVLINRTTVLKPGMVLRNLYIPPLPSDAVNLGAVHAGTMEQSYSRAPVAADGENPMPANEVHEIERQRRIVWEVPINFQLALAQLPTDQLHLIYQPSSDDRHLVDCAFDFYEGFLLGSPAGGVTVIAVETGSKADKAGLKTGDELISINGMNVPDDLSAFPQLYEHARNKAKDYNASSYPIVVRAAGQPETRTVSLPMPPTIKSMLMDGSNL